jgi:hypothetical protein
LVALAGVPAWDARLRTLAGGIPALDQLVLLGTTELRAELDVGTSPRCPYYRGLRLFGGASARCGFC